jgi:hypothetical protein
MPNIYFLYKLYIFETITINGVTVPELCLLFNRKAKHFLGLPEPFDVMHVITYFLLYVLHFVVVLSFSFQMCDEPSVFVCCFGCHGIYYTF